MNMQLNKYNNEQERGRFMRRLLRTTRDNLSAYFALIRGLLKKWVVKEINLLNSDRMVAATSTTLNTIKWRKELRSTHWRNKLADRFQNLRNARPLFLSFDCYHHEPRTNYSHPWFQMLQWEGDVVVRETGRGFF